jgi:hypothetical protein
MSAIAHNPTARAERVNLRAFLAGSGASTALIAAAVVAFLSIATFVAFNGLPFGGGAENSGTVEVGSTPAGAPEAAAAAAGAAPSAVAATPAAPTALPSPGGEVPGATGTPPGGFPIDGSPTPTTPPGSAPGAGPGAPRVPTPAGSGILGGTVGSLEHNAGNLGLNVPLRDLTDPLTGPLDEIVNGTVNTVGSLLGQPKLGDNLGKTVNGVTGAVLGPGGLTDKLTGR